MSIKAVFLLALLSVFLCVLLKKYKGEYAVLLSVCVCLIIFFESFSYFEDVFAFVKNLENESIKGNIEILIKALLISLVSSFVSDICADAGEKALSGRVELFGKMMILAVSLPLFSELYEIVLKILGV